MPKFAVLPLEVEAIQFQWDDVSILQDQAEDLIAEFTDKNISVHSDSNQVSFQVEFPDGSNCELTVNRGDWVVKLKHHFTVFSNEDFNEQYALSHTWLDRVKLEQSRLEQDLKGLDATLNVESKPAMISDEQWILMSRQQFHMRQYNNILLDRIDNAEMDIKTGSTAHGEPVNFRKMKEVDKKVQGIELGSETKLGSFRA